MYEDILKYFPDRIQMCIQQNIKDEKMLEEIRLRSNRPIILKLSLKEKILNYVVTTQDILETLERLCDNSIYSYQTQICEGFITVKGGHRIGIAGNSIIDKDKVININYISGLNFRIAKQIIGVGNNIMKYIVNLNENTIYNTLIISPPGAGKTTILRDVVRQISDKMCKKVSVIDERGEIAAMYKGNSQNDIGIRTDIIDNCSKAIGIKMMVRSMSPDVIVADEIGKDEDVEAINYATCSGVKGIFTAHGDDLRNVEINPTIGKLLKNKVFERLIFLEKGKKGEIYHVYKLNMQNKEYDMVC